MSSPAPSGGSSPLRIGGFALVGLAVVAALVGLFTLATGGESGDPNAAASSTAVAAPPAVDPNAAPSSAAALPPGAAPPPAAAPAPGSPGAPAVPGGPPAAPGTAPTDEAIAPYTPPATEPNIGEGVSAARAPVRVYNNSLVTGLADRAAEDFRGGGWSVDEIGNYSTGTIPTSTVYYQPGEEAAAEALGGQFGLRVQPRFAGLKQASEGLIVIVTKDYRN